MHEQQQAPAAGDVRNCQSCGGGDVARVTVHINDLVKAPESYVDGFPTVLWNRLVARIEKDHEFLYRVGRHTPEEVRVEFAGRILHEAIGFLTLIAKNPGVGFSPSPLVDIGWHNFILYTNEYASWCQATAGRFIHHSPFDEEGVDYGSGHSVRTVDVLRASGWRVDDMLWMSSTLTCDMRVAGNYDCGPCDSGAGYDCGSTHSTEPSANNGNCGSSSCSDACGGGGDDIAMTTVECSCRPIDAGDATEVAIVTANNGNCGTSSCSDACGGGDDIALLTRPVITANDGNCGGQGSGDACGGGQDGGSDGN
ncbi:glycine-rich domain-containing protein [Gordonia sp. NPDC057258]|uniref:glycine-rich domain-containing protein n=1 Tax=unclassified Gordonia (in: high G+C Gram-positive bacteria) TaxID=2657482 RepID=UPI00363BB6C4